MEEIPVRREVDLNEISDGVCYTSNDMAKINCNDCAGCSSCCSHMGDTVVLDPYDIWNLTRGTKLSFMELMQGKIKLSMVDGVILPNLSMDDNNETCSFLNRQGRCTIHEYRPGICRLFPLGRYYENNSFKYILQVNECKKENRTKMKIKKFLGIPSLKEYEEYITDWHYYLKDVEKKIVELTVANEEEKVKNITMLILNTFFITPYDESDFYEQYYERRKKCNV